MDNPENMERLFDEFPPVSSSEWKEKIIAELKGQDYDRKLTWNTREGFRVQPFYTDQDLEDIGPVNSLPGEFPYRRGNTLDNNWHIRQDIAVHDIGKANKKALDILMKGVTSLGFILDPKFEPTIDEIERLCENIYADAVELNFACSRNHLEVVRYVETLAKKYNRKLDAIYGSVDFDPLGRYAVQGLFPESAEASFDEARAMILAARHLPNFRVITVNGTHFHNAGATIVQELAFSLAQGVSYLTQLTERELSINQVAPRIRFSFAIGSDYFMEIARIRAARQLWAHIVKAYGPCDDSKTRMYIHSVTSDWNKTMYDAYVNMLRTTTEAMAGITGGTDSLTINPFNSVFEKPTAFSERIARNQQLLLKEESYFDKVADPAAGSYYIENLTSSIVRESWNLFLEVQERGGFLEAFNGGFIQELVKESARTRDMNLATRKEVLLGLNQYPNPTEKQEKEIPEQVLKSVNEGLAGSTVETLSKYRGAQAFEKLRYQTDRYSQSGGKRPGVFLIPMGSLAMRRARAQFAGNFFGCAGYSIIDNNGFASVEDAARACTKAGAAIAVVCSSDEEYAGLVPKLYDLLKDKAIVVVAGLPKDSHETLQQKGIRHFIHVRSNVLETLREFQALLGISDSQEDNPVH